MRSHITFPFTFLLIINDKQLKNKGENFSFNLARCWFACCRQVIKCLFFYEIPKRIWMKHNTHTCLQSLLTIKWQIFSEQLSIMTAFTKIWEKRQLNFLHLYILKKLTPISFIFAIITKIRIPFPLKFWILLFSYCLSTR